MSSQPDPEWQPLLLERATTRTVRATVSGHDYRISLWIPAGKAPEDGFPSIIVLDGRALFATMAETANRLGHRPEATGVRPTVIIGVAHDGRGLYDVAQRYRDFTPGPSAFEASSHETGGADAFMSFLIDQLLALIGQSVPLDPKRRALFGYSLAGLFTLNTLASHPQAFATYGAISPSIWWDRDLITQKLIAMGHRPSRLFLAAGEGERAPPGSPRGQRQMIESVESLAVLSRELLDEVACHIFPDEDHASVVSVAMTRFLRFSSQSGQS